MSTQPTDAELKTMWQQHAADIGGIFCYARAVLAKWGTPAPVGVEPVARLEIESLKAQLHAAKQINAAQFGLLAASIPGSALRVPHGQAPAGATMYPGCSHWGMRDKPPAAQADSVLEDALDAEVLRDAERYRFIRDVPYSDDVRSVLVHQQNAAMDRVIDAALAAIKKAATQ